MVLKVWVTPGKAYHCWHRVGRCGLHRWSIMRLTESPSNVSRLALKTSHKTRCLQSLFIKMNRLFTHRHPRVWATPKPRDFLASLRLRPGGAVASYRLSETAGFSGWKIGKVGDNKLGSRKTSQVPKLWNKKTAATNGWLIEIIHLDVNRNSLTVWDDNRSQILKPAWVNLKFDAQATNTTKVYIYI